MQADSPEIAFYGYIFSRTGYGTAARAYVQAFHSAAIALSLVSLDRFTNTANLDSILVSLLASLGARRGRRFAPVAHLWHTEPKCAMRLTRSFPQLALMTTWEADSLPSSYIDALNRAAEVWVPSRYNAEVFARQLSVPVFRLPHPVSKLVAPRYTPEEFDREMNLPAGSFAVAAIGTWQERKNLDGVIEAFLRAFPRETDAFLLLKTSFSFVDEHFVRAQIDQAIARANPPDPDRPRDRIRIFPLKWPEDCISSLLHRADCYFSLHRGEGWCYPLFDAASIGVPVVATAYSGPLDYLDPENHRLVGYSLTAAARQQHSIRFSFDSSMRWAEPDIAHAAEQLRSVYLDRAQARKRALLAAARIRRDYSLEAIGHAARQRFLSIAEQALRQKEESLYPHTFIQTVMTDMPALTTPGTGSR